MTISFFAPGIPKGQPRPRAFAFRGKARVYDPGTAEGWKAQIALAANVCKPKEPIEGPVELQVLFQVPRPKSHFKTGKHAGELCENVPAWSTSKPDTDNYLKAVMDALTTIGFWRDDAQVARIVAGKLYVANGPGALINVETL